MAAKYELKKDIAGEFRFNLKAANGEVILSSEAYKAKESALGGIESVRRNAANDARYERKTTASGKFRFNLRASNHEIIGTSQNYETESGRDNGIESVKANAPNGVVKDLT